MHATTDTRRGAARDGRPTSTMVVLGVILGAAAAAAGAWTGYTSQGAARSSPARAAAPLAAAPRVATVPAPAVAMSPDDELPPDAQTLLDGGNAAFRAGRYEVALEHYRAATARAPRHVAPWIGVQMAAQRLGRTALVDSAVAAVRERSGGTDEWSDSEVRRAHDAAPHAGAQRAPLPSPGAGSQR